MTTHRTTSRHASTALPGTRRAPRQRLGLWVSIAATVLLATACTGGPGDQEEFVDVLMLNDNFNEAQATCIAEAVFDTYGEDGDALQKISGAESYEWLMGEDGVEGFDAFFTDTVSSCTAVGPSPDDS